VLRVFSPASLLAGLWLFSALLLTSCAHRVPLMEERVASLPPRTELTDTPFFPQERYQCGPAALATVLNARGVAVTPDELVPQVYLPARQGSLQAEMIAAVRRQGLLAVAIEPELDALLEEVAAGHPVLVLQNLGLDWLPRWHYAVVMGYDLGAQELVLRSGTEPRRITQFGVFLNTWDRSRRWGLVVLTPGSCRRASGRQASRRRERPRSARQAGGSARLIVRPVNDGQTRGCLVGLGNPNTPWGDIPRPRRHCDVPWTSSRVNSPPGTISLTPWPPASAFAWPASPRAARRGWRRITRQPDRP
jgi:hypothetical protein